MPMISRKGDRLLQVLQRKGINASLNDLAQALAAGFDNASVFVVKTSGEILGHYLAPNATSIGPLGEWVKSRRFPEEYNETVLKLGAVLSGDEAARLIPYGTPLIAPIIGGGMRVGTLLVIRQDTGFSEEDAALAEIAAALMGMVIDYEISKQQESDAADRQEATAAVDSLSYSELGAIKKIFSMLEGGEGVLVTSRIADEAGINRSVTANALRKLASANVIESRSLGTKGTYLRITNRHLLDELAKRQVPMAGKSE